MNALQKGKSIIKGSFLYLILLAIFPCFSWAASSLTTDASGLCCANNMLKESTEKQCEKHGGKFYTVKESVKAQKECGSPRSVAPRNAVIPTKSEVAGFCCADGGVKKATKAQCSKLKGNYYRSSALAKNSCKPKKIFCCIDGKISERSFGECTKRKGTAYTSVSEAKRKCKPADVYCCVDGKIKKTSPQQCKQHKGTAYKSVAEAKRKCKPADVYCCVDGIVRKMPSKQCKSRKVTAYKKKIDADKACREERSSRNKPLLQRATAVTKNQPGQVKVGSINGKVGKIPVSSATFPGYCCVDNQVSQMSRMNCIKQKGNYYTTQSKAKQSCQTDLGHCCTKDTVVRSSKKECRKSQGEYFKTSVDAERRCLKQQDVLSRFVPSPGAVSIPVNRVRDHNSSGRTGNVTTQAIESAPDSTHVTGFIWEDSTRQPDPSVTGVLARLQSNDEGRNLIREFSVSVDSNGNFSLDLPPQTSWDLQPVVRSGFEFEPLPIRAVFTGAREADSVVSFIVKRIRENDGGQYCSVEGKALLNHRDPEALYKVNVTQLHGSRESRRTYPVEHDGSFDFLIPPGQYGLDLEYFLPFQRHRLVTGIQSQHILCDPSFVPEINIEFSGDRLPTSRVHGYVHSNDSVDRRLTSLTLRDLDTNAVSNVLISNTGTYSVDVLSGGTYTLTPDVPEGWDTPNDLSFAIPEFQLEHIVNFDLERPQFSLTDLNLTQIRSHPAGMALSAEFSLGTRVVGGGGRSFNKSVRLSSQTNPQISMVQNCVFDADSTCLLTLYLDGFDYQNESLRAEIVDCEQESSCGKNYSRPLRNVGGDLDVKYKGAIDINVTPGRHTDFTFQLKNIGPGDSTPCRVTIKINSLPPDNLPIPQIVAGEYHTINFRKNITFDLGDVVEVQISNSCDQLTQNNFRRWEMIEEYYQ